MTQTTTVPPLVASYPYLETEDSPPTGTEWNILRLMRELREKRKSCMIVLRFDGLAWQLLEARPSGRWPE